MRSSRSWSGVETLAEALCAATLLFIAANVVADSLLTVFRLHSDLPYWDEWDSLDLFKDLMAGHDIWAHLFSQHNEHRILFPRLVIFSDYLFFRGCGRLNVLAIILIQAVHALTFMKMGRHCRSSSEMILAASVAVMLLFSLHQEENFIWGFQVQFVGVFALATTSSVLFCSALERYREGLPHRMPMVRAFVAVSVATFSMANGLLIAFVLPVLACAARAPLRLTLVPLALALLLTLSYFHGYQSEPTHTPLAFSLTHPIPVLSYTTIYLGSFLDPNIQASRLLGLWGLLAMAAAAWRVLVMVDRDRTRSAMLGVMLFTAGSAGITALGRLGFGVEQAFASRYSTGSAAFWSALVLFWSSVPLQRRTTLAVRALTCLTVAVLVFGVIRSQGAIKPGMESRAYQQREAADALLLGVRDEDAFGAVDDSSDTIERLARFLKARGLSVFSERDARLVGGSVSAAGRLSGSASCEGSVDVASIAPDLGIVDAARISGHVRARHGAKLTDRVYVVDAGGAIVGLASRESPFSEPSIWHGFLLSPKTSIVRAFARLQDDSLCEFGRASVASP